LGTGIDNIDLDTALNLGIPVTYTPGINALSVAEHTLGLALAALRRAAHCQDVLRRGGWRDETTIGTQLSGQTVGIIGFGDIGERFASLLGGFDVEILANDPYIQPEDTEITGVELVDREIILLEADLVSVNTELTDETRGMLGRKEFQRIKSTAALVNTARGAVLQEAELVEALKKGEIAAAGLDVFTDEPLDASSSLHELENVVLTPHVGARTKQASTACIDRLIDNVFRLLSGNPVPDRYLAVQPVQSSSEV
jgi:D-3-phosphoglycerate dehydrogenase